jgi:uncharacterized membrane protein
LLRPLPFGLELITYALLMGAFEYVSGVVVVRVWKRRLWDYRDTPWHLHGHTAPHFALGWGALSMLLVYVLNPLLLAYFH